MPIQKCDENSGEDRMNLTRSTPCTKPGSIGIHSSCPLGGSVSRNHSLLQARITRAKVIYLRVTPECFLYLVLWLPGKKYVCDASKDIWIGLVLSMPR